MDAKPQSDATAARDPGRTLLVRAELVGERLLAQAPDGWRSVASAPVLLEAPNGGWVALLRYGAVVFFEVGAEDQAALRTALSVRHPLSEPGYEVVTIRVSPGTTGHIESGVIHVPDLRPERLQLIAVVLAKSVALEHHERAIERGFDAVEPLARELHLRPGPGRRARALLSHIGGALLAETQMSGRVEVRDKPDLLWDLPELERFYVRLEDEYELHERATELERKLDLTSRTARTALELLQHRHTLRVEWYIVVLIVIEIALSLYALWRG